MRFRTVAICLILFVGASPVLADTVDRDNAGLEESRFRQDQEKLAEKRLLEQAQPVIKETASSSEAAEDSGPSFLVSEVKFLGNHSISSERLKPIFRDYLGKQVTLTQMQEAVRELKTYYRDHGFVAVYAYIPPQDIVDGVLKVDVMEGRLAETKLSETRWYSGDKIRRMLRLKKGDLLTKEGLYRDLARINRYPDLKATVSLEAGKQMGTSDVQVKIEERAPYHLSGTINNQGSKNTGKYLYGATASHNNLTGRFDEVFTTVQASKGVTALGAGYTLPVSEAWGTKLGYTFTHADVDVGGQFAPLNVEGRARTHGLTLYQPALETQALEATLKLGFDLKHSENKILGRITGHDDLSVARVGMDFKETDASGLAFSPHSLHWGLSDFLGSNNAIDAGASRAASRSDFFAYRGGLTRFQKISDIVMASLRTSWQVTPDILPPSEQFQIGGAQSVRGYQQSEYVADNGIYAMLDLYLQSFFIPDSWKMPVTGESIQKGVQLFVFSDLGAGTLESSRPGELTNRQLASAGAGVRVHLFDKFYARAEWGFPLGDRPLDHRNSAAHFTVSYELF